MKFQDAKASIDLNDNDDDPRPRDSDPDNWYVQLCIIMLLTPLTFDTQSSWLAQSHSSCIGILLVTARGVLVRLLLLQIMASAVLV